MTYGISVANASGYTQIDQDYSNYVVLQAGSATTATVYNKPTTDPRAILMISCDDPNGYLYSMEVHNGVFIPSNQWGVYIEYVTYGYASTNYVTFYYAWLLPADAVAESADQYGLTVYRPDGSLAFSSRHTQMLIVAAWRPTADGTNETFTLPASSKRRYISASGVKIYAATGYCIPDGGGCWVDYDINMVKFASGTSLVKSSTTETTAQTAQTPDPGPMSTPTAAQIRLILVAEL